MQFEKENGNGNVSTLLSPKRKTVIANQQKKSDKYPCKTCNKRFASRSLLLRHENGHSNMKPFQCKTCQQKFTQKSSLDRHESLHSGKRAHQCPKCHLRFSQKSNLVIHIGRVHPLAKEKDGNYQCPLCSCAFSKLNSLSRHKTMAHPRGEIIDDTGKTIDTLLQQLKTIERVQENPSDLELTNPDKADANIQNETQCAEVNFNNEKFFDCSICQKRFKRSHDVVRHLRVHTKEKPFKCDICDSSFSLKSTLKSHKGTHEKTGSSEYSKVYTCQVCLKKFSSLRSIDFHSKHSDCKHSAEKQFACTDCEKTFPTSISLSNHKRLHVSKLPEIESLKKLLPRPIELKGNVREVEEEYEVRRYQCSVCGVRMIKLSHLKQHELTHSSLKPFQCEFCNGKFVTQSALKIHLKLHSPEKTSICSICQAAFRTNGSLQRHMRVHSSARNFGCTYCPATFKTRDNCTAHIETHLKYILDPPHEIENSPKSTQEESTIKTVAKNIDHKEIPSNDVHCNVCSKTFQKPSDLLRHINVHTKEKPFKCAHCGKGFAIKSTLDSHMNVHSSHRNNYSCPVCGKNFAATKSLKIHLRLHTGEKPFQCEICQKSFRTSGHRIAHMKNHDVEKSSGSENS